jgi:NAD(P)H-dependent FMN reductase/AcrR family transcriptional regulator
MTGQGGQVAGTENVPKERLLRAAMSYVAEHGVADLSLRRLAAAIGTSHRMLIYHFGSKEGLLIEVIRAVEAEQRQSLAELEVDPSLSPTDVARRMWQHLSDPALWPNERLFFEIYGRALQARPHTVEFLDDVVESWLAPIAAMRRAQGIPRELARAQARLELATARGLLLDLLATGDRSGVDDAVEQSIALFETWRAHLPAAQSPAATDLADAVPSTHAFETGDQGRVLTAFPRTKSPPSITAETADTRVLLVSGSLRRESTNTAALRTARAVSPERVTTVLYDNAGALPHFNPDDDVIPLHPAVADLRMQIRKADALLFSTPEYAGGLPGSFKNLLDWTIGDDQAGSIYQKPVAWINTSVRSAADAHESLRNILGYANAQIVEDACAHIPIATTLVDDDDLIGDLSVRDTIARSLTVLAGFAADASRTAVPDA